MKWPGRSAVATTAGPEAGQEAERKTAAVAPLTLQRKLSSRSLLHAGTHASPPSDAFPLSLLKREGDGTMLQFSSVLGYDNENAHHRELQASQTAPTRVLRPYPKPRASRRRSSTRLAGRRRGSSLFFELEPTLQPNLTNSVDRPGPGVSVSDGGSLKEGPSWPQVLAITYLLLLRVDTIFSFRAGGLCLQADGNPWYRIQRMEPGPLELESEPQSATAPCCWVLVYKVLHQWGRKSKIFASAVFASTNQTTGNGVCDRTSLRLLSISQPSLLYG